MIYGKILYNQSRIGSHLTCVTHVNSGIFNGKLTVPCKRVVRRVYLYSAFLGMVLGLITYYCLIFGNSVFTFYSEMIRISHHF